MMPAGYRNSAGVDFDELFDPYEQGEKPAPTGYRTSDGADLCERYAPLAYGSKGPDVGYRNSAGLDLSNLWAARGTAQYITWNLPPIFAAGNSNQLHPNGHASFELRNNGEIWTYVNNPGAVANKLANYVSDPSKLSQYEVLVTKTSGNATVENAGSWQNLGTSRWFGYDVNVLDTTYTAVCTVQIRKVGTTTIVASTTASLSARWSSGSGGGPPILE